MSRKARRLALSAVVLTLTLVGPLSADEVALPELAVEAVPRPATPAPVEEPAPVPIEPLAQTDYCYTLSTCTPSFAACESWCYGQNCGINYWDPGPQICYCGTKF